MRAAPHCSLRAPPCRRYVFQDRFTHHQAVREEKLVRGAPCKDVHVARVCLCVHILTLAHRVASVNGEHARARVLS